MLLQSGLIDRSRPYARADDCLDAIDEAALDDGVTPVHAEFDRSRDQIFVIGLGLALEEAHIEDQSLANDRVDLVQAEREGLLQPEGVLDDLILDRARFGFGRRAAHLPAIALDPLIDLASPDLDTGHHGGVRPGGLEREE